MFLIITKIEHPLTRNDYRFVDSGHKVFNSERFIGSKVKSPKTRAELEALYCDDLNIEIVRRYSVRFELRSRYRTGNVVKSRYDGSRTIKGEHITGDDAEAVSVRREFWRWLESTIAKENQSTIERIRKQAEAVIPRP
jgi:hypothetical protein